MPPTTGTITSVSEEFGEVDITTPVGFKSLHFRELNFYAFGIRCDGVLADFLQVGMQVSVCYTLNSHDLQILGVWLGNRPDNLDYPLYNREGRIVHVGDDSFIVQTNFDHHTSLVRKDVVFWDGYPLKDSAASVNVDDCLMFDAVPIKSHASCFEYLATCAWFGPNEPRLLDRFRHSIFAGLDETYLEIDKVVGRVAVIPNDNVAVVDVETFNSGKVILPKEFFDPPCESLKYAVDVDERVIMRLRFGYYYSDEEMWFAVGASKHPGSECKAVVLEIIECQESVDPDDLDNVSNIYCSDEQDDMEAESEQGASNVLFIEEELVFQQKDDTEIGDKLKSEDELKDDVERASKVGCLKIVSVPDQYDTKINVPRNTIEEGKELVGDSDVLPQVLGSENVVAVPLPQGSYTAIPFSEDIVTEEEADLVVVYEGPQKSPRSVDVLDLTNSPRKNLVDTDEAPVFHDENRKRELEGGSGRPPKVLCSDKAAVAPDSTTDIHQTEHTGNDKREEERVGWKDIAVRELLPLLGESPKNEIDTGAPAHQHAAEVKDGVETSSSTLSSKDESKKTRAEAMASVLHDKADTKETKGPEGCPKSYREKKAPLGRVYRGVSFQRSSPSGNRSLLLDWSGIISHDHEDVKFVPLVEPSFGKVSSKLDDLVVHAMNDNKPVTYETLMVNGNNVYFDAERTSSSYTDDFKVQRIWFRHSARPFPELLLMSKLKNSGSVTFDRAEDYRGRIVSVPFHDCAIANVDDVPILVKFKSLVIDQVYNESCSTIEMFLNVGSAVFVKVEEKTTGGENYFEAKKCWNEVICKKTCPKEENVSWFDIWRKGKFSEQGTISLKDGYVGVSFGRLESFDAGNSKFLNDGVSSTLSELAELVSSKITCHVAHKEKEFVACAWIGKAPTAYAVLKDRISIPKGLVKETKNYEGVVEDFPLPDRVVCKIGVVPVLGILIPVMKKKDTFTEVVEKDLRTGQRVFLNVEEEKIQNAVFIVCKHIIVDECNDDNKVLVNFPGRIVKKPKSSSSPSGLIEANGGGFQVSFEMCCVRNMCVGGGDIFSWSRLIRSKMQVGANVHFTTKKGNRPEKPQYGYEVRIDNL